MSVEPLANRVALRVPPTPERVGLIWIPSEVQESTYGVCQAEIMAVGAGVRDVRLQPGLRVIVRRFGGFALDEDKQEWICCERDVLAIVDA
jgi:co-chaperonin GroES (HSP10)